MKNKPAHKKTSAVSHKRKSSSEQTVIWYSVIVFSLILMVFANVGYKLSKPHVLGASTVFLAEGGSDSGSGGLDSSGSNGVAVPVSGQTSVPAETTTGQTISGDVLVDCVGPDGKHFVVDFHACQELNQQWGHSTFTFTPLSGTNQQSGQGDSKSLEEKSHTTIETPLGKLEVQQEGNKREINLEQKGLHVELKAEDNGTVSAVAQRDGGKDIKLSAKDALEKLNDQLKDQDIEISSSEGQLSIRKGSVEAQTHFPLSINPTTGHLTVTTPAGTKDVAVLPDKAVENLLATGVFSGVVSQSPTASSGATEQTQLTDVNGIPAYQVVGVLSKKLFGLFPMSFTKTAFVSATDGHTIDVQQSSLTSFLEALSF